MPRPAAPAAAAAAAPAFTGYRKDAMQFWHELAAEMNRDWFTANKARYEREWVAPTTALLADVARRLAPAYKPLALGAPKVLRIHRDVRFAADKTPYKTHLGAVIRVEDKKVSDGGTTALYLHLGLDEEFVGYGSYMFPPDQLARFRKAVAGAPGVELARLVARLRAAGHDVGGHDDYKKVPKGFPPDHPRADLLRCKGLTGAFPSIPRGLPLKPGFADWLADHATTGAPLVRWLHAHTC